MMNQLKSFRVSGPLLSHARDTFPSYQELVLGSEEIEDSVWERPDGLAPITCGAFKIPEEKDGFSPYLISFYFSETV